MLSPVTVPAKVYRSTKYVFELANQWKYPMDSMVTISNETKTQVAKGDCSNFDLGIIEVRIAHIQVIWGGIFEKSLKQIDKNRPITRIEP